MSDLGPIPIKIHIFKSDGSVSILDFLIRRSSSSVNFFRELQLFNVAKESSRIVAITRNILTVETDHEILLFLRGRRIEYFGGIAFKTEELLFYKVN